MGAREATGKVRGFINVEVLNEMGNAGWELATTSERDSRWMGGETILLTFRRGVVTEDDFRDRARAEERIRRRVVAELDAEDAT